MAENVEPLEAENEDTEEGKRQRSTIGFPYTDYANVEAIAEAIRIAKAGDIILLAGKGHETGQIIGAGPKQRVLPFDDALVARECAS